MLRNQNWLDYKHHLGRHKYLVCKKSTRNDAILQQRSISTKIPLLCMLEEARHYIRDQNGLELTCEINSFSWLVKSRLFATTGHLYLIYDHLFYVHWLSFYRGYNIVRLYRPSFTWTIGQMDRLRSAKY